MRDKLNISIPQPCTNRWEEMTFAGETKRHCSSCEKVVTDFRQMSDDQLFAYFKTNGVSCGVFAPHQLNRQIRSKKKKRNRWLTTLALPTLLAFTEAHTQEPVSPATSSLHTDSSTQKIRIPLDDVFHTMTDTLIVSGTVFDNSDSLHEFPLIGALVLFHLPDSTVKQCVTDTSGNFQIKLAHVNVGETVRVEVRSIGYVRSDTQLVLTPEPVQMKIESHFAVMGANVVTYTPQSRFRQFIWRLFHPRSWFW